MLNLWAFSKITELPRRNDPERQNWTQHNRLLWEADELLESSGLPNSANLSTGPNIPPSLIHYQCRIFSPGMITFSLSEVERVVSWMHIFPNIGTGWPVDLLQCRTIAISSFQPVQYPSKNAQNSTVRKASHRSFHGQPKRDRGRGQAVQSADNSAMIYTTKAYWRGI